MPPLAITVTDAGIDLSLSPGTTARTLANDIAYPRVRVSMPQQSGKSRSQRLDLGDMLVKPKKTVRFSSPMTETHVVPSIWALCETRRAQPLLSTHNEAIKYFTALERREEYLRHQRKQLEATRGSGGRPALRESSFADMWFCAAELQEIKQNCYRTIAFALSHAIGDFEENKENDEDILNASIPLPPLPRGFTEPPCLRGLEHKTPKAAMRRLQVKRSSWTAVLDEQDRQWSIAADYNDPERIGEIYRQTSAVAAQRARDMGRRDAEEAQRVWADDIVEIQNRRRIHYALHEEADTLYEVGPTDRYSVPQRARTVRSVKTLR